MNSEAALGRLFFIRSRMRKAHPSSFTVHLAFTTVAAQYGGMLFSIAVLLVVLWFLGVVSSYTLGGFIHLLLLLAVVIVLVRLIRGENPL